MQRESEESEWVTDDLIRFISPQKQDPAPSSFQEQQQRRRGSATEEEVIKSAPSVPPPLPQPPLVEFEDLLEVNNELINIEQECLWLCDPKAAQSTSSANPQPLTMTHGKHAAASRTTSKGQQQVLVDVQNSINNEQSTVVAGANVHEAGKTANSKAKNPYKWLVEEFEDKNLDKVKRTLLVTLDDISKGISRRSRSMSTSRTPFYNQMNPHFNQNAYHHIYQANIQNQNPYGHGGGFLFDPFASNQYSQQYYQRLNHNYNADDSTAMAVNPPQQTSSASSSIMQQSKSIESILNESTADVVDASSNFNSSSGSGGSCGGVMPPPHPHHRAAAAGTNAPYSTATITKRRGNQPPRPNLYRIPSEAVPNPLVAGGSGGEMSAQVDLGVHNFNNHHQLDDDEQPQSPNEAIPPAAQYQDLIDVQVVARMQQESLRQSVLNLNKLTDNNNNNKANNKKEEILESHYLLQQNQTSNRGTYNSSTITKRTSSSSSSNWPKPPTPSFDFQGSSKSLRRDSASSTSDHSSVSSNASTSGSPYASHLNVNVAIPPQPTSKRSPHVITTSNPRRSGAATPHEPAVPPQQPHANYQTITKTSKPHSAAASTSRSGSNSRTTVTHNAASSSTTSSSSRSNTPLRQGAAAHKPESSRLPTPRTSYGTGSSDASFASSNGSASSASNKPPPVPTSSCSSTAATSSNGGLAARRSGRAPLAYGGQRSATTSIVASPTSNTTWQQVQAAKILLQKQQQRPAAANPKQTHQVPPKQPPGAPPLLSPSSSSSLSASSSANQIAPLNSSSPHSRHASPKATSSSSGGNSVVTVVVSPSGLLTDGPFGARRPVGSTTTGAQVMPNGTLRDRSASPLKQDPSKRQHSSQHGGSNSNLHTIQETKIPMASPPSPTTGRKLVHQQRKSFLPQPVQQQLAPPQQSDRRQPSSSPVRSNGIRRALSPNWNEGCY